ncbi:MAG: hypothetical protein ACK5O2_00780 [Microthrixaceae bacterium]
MTHELRARVRRYPYAPTRAEQTRYGLGSSKPWSATLIAALEDTTGRQIALRAHYAPTWAEAMQQAYAMLAAEDRRLMDAVHASRASRRLAGSVPTPPDTKPAKPACRLCHPLTDQLHSGRHPHRPLIGREVYAHCDGTPDADPHTMEATA